jgi:TonB family protein
VNLAAGSAVYTGMFDTLLEARRPIPKWVAPTLAMAILLHACALSAAIVHGYWDVDRLPVPKGRVDLVIPAPNPPPPAGAKPRAPKPTDAARPAVHKAPDTTQPVKLSAQVPAPTGGADGGGTGNGLGQGNGIGDGTGECVGIACGPEIDSDPPPEIPKSTEPPIRNEPIDVVDRNFVSGERQIHPEDTTRTRMSRDGLTRTKVVVKMCLSGAGRVTSLEMIASSGYPEYDAKIRTKMRAWRYSPFKGDATICTPVTFHYNLR